MILVELILYEVLTVEYTRGYEERRVVTVSTVLFTFYDDIIAVGRVFSTTSNKHKRLMHIFIQVPNSVAKIYQVIIFN